MMKQRNGFALLEQPTPEEAEHVRTLGADAW